jgi:hypothetical protein
MTRRWRLGELLARGLVTALAIVILVIALAFSLVIFAIVLAVASIALGYAWWRVRSMRSRGGRIIDAERGREVRPRDPR